jgi:hypothetical protein
MAQVDLELSFDSNRIGNKKKIKNQLLEFENKWKKEVELFNKSLFQEDKKGDVWLLTMPGKEINISTRDYSSLDKGPNLSKAVFKLFSNVSESVGDCDFGFGEKAFSKAFYKDLIELYLLENKSGGYSFYANVTVIGYSGYYSGSYEFLEDGSISETFTFYNSEDEDGEEEDYDDEN